MNRNLKLSILAVAALTLPALPRRVRTRTKSERRPSTTAATAAAAAPPPAAAVAPAVAAVAAAAAGRRRDPTAKDMFNTQRRSRS